MDQHRAHLASRPPSPPSSHPLINKRSVSFVDSTGLAHVSSPTEAKLVEARRVLEEEERSALKDDNCFSHEHACISLDWKTRYGGRVLTDEAESEDLCILQRVVLPSETAPKRKREAHNLEATNEFEVPVKRLKPTPPFIAPIEQAQNSLVCKVYMVDPRSSVNRWRRLLVPSSTFSQTLVDIVVNSFDLPAASFYAKRHGTDKLIFKGGPNKKSVKHALLVPFSDLNLEPGDGFDIFYGSQKLSVHIEYVRDVHSLKYNIEGVTGFTTFVNNVQIIGGNAGEIFL